MDLEQSAYLVGKTFGRRDWAMDFKYSFLAKFNSPKLERFLEKNFHSGSQLIIVQLNSSPFHFSLLPTKRGDFSLLSSHIPNITRATREQYSPSSPLSLTWVMQVPFLPLFLLSYKTYPKAHQLLPQSDIKQQILILQFASADCLTVENIPLLNNSDKQHE